MTLISKVFPDGEKRLLDVDEYELHSKIMQYPQDIDFILKENVKILVDWINNGKGPFSQGYVDIWYDRYKQLSTKISKMGRIALFLPKKLQPNWLEFFCVSRGMLPSAGFKFRLS